MHTNYQPARRGLEATRIMAAKRLRLTKNLTTLDLKTLTVAAHTMGAFNLKIP
ncbi:hypothetical protein Pf1_00004 [Pseudomonas phage Pf1 ERZ-2017]|uniref:Uncharacterized protein n=1 Tax=Pseudomonas phage Pf1 ERZ-2017 TaxID=2761363 RepID=A0A2H4YGC1_9CAUD|nr:hypothetical protein HOS27_gp04 [Pseudomonas phage Pf1 ERZ-2017]AUE23183.1 hypothetical protein Pf1_00004 [Pseudomonas phage Pf1 ERZ-2017]